MVLLHGAPPVSDLISHEELKPGNRSLINAIRFHPARLTAVAPEEVDAETLWLARVIYSESKYPEEQELVAWVVRNRVETRYRGRTTYRDVVLDPFQFSAFNIDNPKRDHYISLSPWSRARGWQRALSIAHHVRRADSTMRPFSVETRHFYSEISMVGREYPTWAVGLEPVTPERRYRPDARRFRFYEGIS